MAFDPTLPAPNSDVMSGELRDNFNGLKEFIDAQVGVIAAVQAQAGAQAAQITALQTQNAALETQVAALQAGLAQKPGAPEVQAIIAAQAARNVDGVGQLPPPWDMNPPSREEFDAATTKINELIQGLGHPA